MKETTVEMNQASFFNCPFCRKTGWVKWIRIENPDIIAKITGEVGAKCLGLTSVPSKATCRECGKTFEVALRESSMKETTVELHDAFYFICPECGNTGWVKATRIEMGDEEMRTMDEEMGFSGPGMYMKAPEQVTCENCKKNFEATMEGEDDEDDDV